jgi:hypothetical protein
MEIPEELQDANAAISLAKLQRHDNLDVNDTNTSNSSLSDSSQESKEKFEEVPSEDVKDYIEHQFMMKMHLSPKKMLSNSSNLCYICIWTWIICSCYPVIGLTRTLRAGRQGGLIQCIFCCMLHPHNAPICRFY